MYEQIIEKLKMKSNNIIENCKIIIGDCNFSTISHIFNFIYLGLNKIYLGECCPNIINPQLLDGLYEIYNIKEITTNTGTQANIIKVIFCF